METSSVYMVADNRWAITLGEVHAPYPQVVMHRGFLAVADYTMVIVDTVKFIECCNNDGRWIEPANQWERSRLHKHRDNLNPTIARGGSLKMPVVGIYPKKYFVSKWWGWSGSWEDRHAIRFTNGRHRTRYLEFAGAKAFPVEVELSQAQLLRETCGAS